MSLLTESGVPAPGVDSPVAWHFGDPLGEQRALISGAGIVDRSHRDVVTVTGVDRLAWLHSITSQHVSELSDGDSVESLVLSPHGHVEQHWQLTELGDTVWIDTEPGEGPTVLAYLDKMRFLKRVESSDVSADWAVVSLVGPTAGDVLTESGLPTPGAGRAIALTGGGFVRGMAWPLEASFDLLVPRSAAAGLVRRLADAGAVRTGIWAFEAARVQARRPRFGHETDHRTIPHEVGWIGTAVHLDKGCYRGQETVARVQNLGRPPRRLVLLYLTGESDVLPVAGTPVEFNGKTVGFVGTAVHHHELGPIALAVVKRAVGTDDQVTVEGRPVAVEG